MEAKRKIFHKKDKIRLYRNLNRGTKFSWQVYKKGRGWIVQGWIEDVILINCEFEVGEKGADRAVDSQQRNVHAFVYCTNFFEAPTMSGAINYGKEIRYNPYDGTKSFLCEGLPIYSANKVVLTNGKAYKV